MYTYWAIKRSSDKDEGVYVPLTNFGSGKRGDFDEVILHRLTKNLLTVTAINGEFERSLKKLKKASCWSQRGGFKKGEKIKILELVVKKNGSHPSANYALIIIGEVKIDDVKDVDASPGKGQDNYSVVTMTLKGTPRSQHSNEYARIQGEAA